MSNNPLITIFVIMVLVSAAIVATICSLAPGNLWIAASIVVALAVMGLLLGLSARGKPQQ